jgi:hypothetical protein
MSRTKLIRIISIGEPVHRPDKPKEKGLAVPCKVEMSVKGETSVQDFSPWVRPVYNQPERWDIFGHF